MVAGLALVALLLSAYAAGRWGVLGAIALGLASVLWLVVNGPVEGRILIEFSAAHGLSAADLAGLTGLVLAVVVMWRNGGGP